MSKKDATHAPEEEIDAQAPEGEAEAVTELELTDEELVALCKARVCPACDEQQQADADRLRSLAEMDNFKKRMAREQEDFRKYAAESVLADLLPILDNLGLAIAHGKMNEACKDVVMGVEMTEKIFVDTLKSHGLTQVGVVGEPFNPEVHEAVGHEEHEEMEDGVVCGLLQKGYLLRERLLRPAKVMVNKRP